MVGRPKKVKTVNYEPDVTYFKPRAVPLNKLKEIELSYEELEALRLANLEGLSQIDAAKKMDVHQTTFHRTLVRAREKATDALVHGKAIRIHGGEYKMPGGDGTGPMGPRGPRRGYGRGRGPMFAGPGGKCKCPECGHEQAHIRGQPCNRTKCEECGALMVRE